MNAFYQHTHAGLISFFFQKLLIINKTRINENQRESWFVINQKTKELCHDDENWKNNGGFWVARFIWCNKICILRFQENDMVRNSCTDSWLMKMNFLPNHPNQKRLMKNSECCGLWTVFEGISKTKEFCFLRKSITQAHIQQTSSPAGHEQQRWLVDAILQSPLS